MNWNQIVNEVSARTHPVDRDAIRIWFAMWPEILPELEARAEFYQLKGATSLAANPSSHRFLHGYRYWGDILKVVDRGEPISRTVERSNVPPEYAWALAAIAHRMLESDALPAQPDPQPPIVIERATPHRRMLSKRDRVIFNERSDQGFFPILKDQEITGAAEMDKRPHHLNDKRCYEGMGVIPVDCRSGSCGTCWIGILGGNENLSPADDFERKRIEYFGYWDSGFIDTSVERPLIRLACQTRARGSVSIAIPPWNGVFGRSRRES